MRAFLVGGAGALAGAALLFASGIVDVASSPQPSWVTDWLFRAAVRQSVTLRSMNIEVPPLDDPALVRRAAGHYDFVCADCHGGPGRLRAPFADGLSPQPPLLAEQMDLWRPPARVFWTVKHGIRHSAMPAWPAQIRDDEVWALVAFLQDLPDLNEREYAALAGAPGDVACERCHTEGDTGQRPSGIPDLRILSPEYLAHTLRSFRDGRRPSGIMINVARNLGDEQIEDLAVRYGENSIGETGVSDLGRTVAEVGIPDRKIPPCQSCHGAGARQDYPRLAGQDRDYILNQLQLFRTLGQDRGGRYAAIMTKVAQGLSEDELHAVADWYGDSR